MEYKYTSLELSKKLAKGGCKIESDYYWEEERYRCGFYQYTGVWHLKKGKYKSPYDEDDKEEYHKAEEDRRLNHIVLAYDILNDICIKYPREFFGDTLEHNSLYEITEKGDPRKEKRYKKHTRHILEFLQENKKQEAEDYIWEHCLFNNKNK